MHCQACGTENPEGTLRCIHCSSSLDAAVTPVPAASDASDPEITSLGTPAGSLAGWVRAHAHTFSATLPPGLTIGQRYEIRALLGRGGMGAVYRAYDRELDREVALKLIRADLAEDSTVVDRFKREIQLSSKVTHRNVLRVYDLGESDGVKFLTMEDVAGDDLATVLRRERLPLPRVLEIFRQICEGLAAAHAEGILHRDLKPQNVMLDAEGRVHLTDFGLAKSLTAGRFTQTGAVLGTPLYMSPEQVRGESVDVRSDIYALGTMLYEMLTGAAPFSGESGIDVMLRRIQKSPRPVGDLNPEVPLFLQKITERCLAIDPAPLPHGEGASDRSRRRAMPSLSRIGCETAGPASRTLAGRWNRGRGAGHRGRGVPSEAGRCPRRPDPKPPSRPSRSSQSFLFRTGQVTARSTGRRRDCAARGRQPVAVASAPDRLDGSRGGAANREYFGCRARARRSSGRHRISATGEILPGPGGVSVSARLTSAGEAGREVAARRLTASQRPRSSARQTTSPCWPDAGCGCLQVRVWTYSPRTSLQKTLLPMSRTSAGCEPSAITGTRKPSGPFQRHFRLRPITPWRATGWRTYAASWAARMKRTSTSQRRLPRRHVCRTAKRATSARGKRICRDATMTRSSSMKT